MRDDRLDDRFERELREALHLELATVRVGVAAPQVRGRIAARQRTRRTTQLMLVAAALGMAIVGGLVVAGRLLSPPPPTGAEPATVAAVEETSGDLVVSSAWPDGRTETQWRFPRAVDRVREATGDPNATRLPAGAVAAAGPDGWLAIALPGDDILYFRQPAAGSTELLSGAIGGGGGAGSFGWTADGRIVTVGDDSSARLVASFFDPATGVETSSTIPAGVVPDWARGETPRLTWTGDGEVVAERVDRSTFGGEIGSLDITALPPTFTPGLPASVRADTGLETRYGADGRHPGSWCQDGRLSMRCAGIGGPGEQSTAPAETWYAARADEALAETVRTADGRGLLVVARSTAADRGRLIVGDAPGSWREGFAFDAPTYDVTSPDPGRYGNVYLVGVAPEGGSVALQLPTGLLVGDLGSGATATLPAGTVFVGWGSEPVVATSRLATVRACEAATTGDAAEVALSAAGVTSPASAGVKPVVGERGDPDPYRRDEAGGTPAVAAEADGLLSLALPRGVCAEATIADAVPVDGPPGGTSTELGAWLAGNGTIAGLVTVVAPPPGDWVMRVRLWLAGADREAILLYRVATTGEPKPVTTPEPPPSPTPTPSPSPSPTPSPTPSPEPTSPSSPTPAGLAPDTVAVVVATDAVVMRSAPEISDTSEIYTPALTEGAELYLWEGPVRASGYDWYRVLPLSAKYPGVGWVAAASRDGDPWIEPARATCPKAPIDVAGLASLTGGQSLACFGAVPITVRARITPCNCNTDPGYGWDPAWFGGPIWASDSVDGFGRLVLADPERSAPVRLDGSNPWLYLDPAGTHPDPLPVGEVVEVTGMFDHPAARGCAASYDDGGSLRFERDAPLWCRTSFVVTEMR